MTERKALKLALEALETLDRVVLGTQRAEDAITAIKEALAQPDQLFEENERLHVENRRLIDRIETIGVPVGVGGFVTTTTQPEQEPVAWFDPVFGDICKVVKTLDKPNRYTIPLYAKPPQRTWIGLTDEEELKLAHDSMGKSRHWLVAQVETKLKQKNGYAEEKNT